MACARKICRTTERKSLKKSLKIFQKNKQLTDQNKKDVELKVGDEVFVDMGMGIKLNRGKLEEIRNRLFKIIQKIHKVHSIKKGTVKYFL